MRKRGISLLLSLLMVFSLLPFGAAANDSYPYPYEISDGHVILTYTDRAVGDLVIPDTIEGYPVTEVGSWAFQWSTGLTSVVIPDSVVAIRYGAFHDCENLKSVQLPKDITVIEQYTFQWTGLNSIEIPNKVTTIKEEAFFEARQLKYIVLPVSLNTVEKDAFKGCTALNTVYYAGTEAQWQSIAIDEGNEPLQNADVHFNSSAPDPAESPDVTPLPCTHSETVTLGAKDATCTEEGYTGDQYCPGCGEIVQYGSSIPAKGHDWGDWEVATAPTCTEKGVETRVCANDSTHTETRDVEAKGHELEKTDAVPATKEQSGNIEYYTCASCGKLFSDAEGKKEIAKADTVIPAIGQDPVVNPFTDVKTGAYYCDPVLWAVNHTPQITNGTGAGIFSPDATCTRGQVVTFLWRAMGCPEPTSASNDFVDVKPGDYFYKAVLWTAEKGITNGADASHFNPGGDCTRAHVVTFLWRAHEKPAAGNSNPFKDVAPGQYYTDAVLWAVSKDITNGIDASHFGPDNPCTRGQIVTFLYRDMK